MRYSTRLEEIAQVKGMQILIADDNERVRGLIKRLIADLCDEVFECSDGESAVRAYAERQPDWVLMDIELGEVDGLDATRRIKAEYPEARIVIVTNYDDSRLRQSAIDAGACAYVLKENLSALLELVRETEAPKPRH